MNPPQEVHILEDNLDNSLREGATGTERDKWPSQLADQNVRFEVRVFLHATSPYPHPNQNELDQMRKRLGEAEIKHARTVHGVRVIIHDTES
jgi:hypothetical protein